MSKVTKPKAGVKHISHDTYIETFVKGLGLIKRTIPTTNPYQAIADKNSPYRLA